MSFAEFLNFYFHCDFMIFLLRILDYENIGKGISITGHEGPWGNMNKGPHIRSHVTRKR